MPIHIWNDPKTHKKEQDLANSLEFALACINEIHLRTCNELRRFCAPNESIWQFFTRAIIKAFPTSG